MIYKTSPPYSRTRVTYVCKQRIVTLLLVSQWSYCQRIEKCELGISYPGARLRLTLITNTVCFTVYAHRILGYPFPPTGNQHQKPQIPNREILVFFLDYQEFSVPPTIQR